MHIRPGFSHAVLVQHHLRRDTGTDAEQGTGSAAGRTDRGQSGAVVAGAGDKDHAVAVYDLRVFLINAAHIRPRCGTAVTHVDEVALVLQHGNQSAHGAGAGGAGAEAGVSDFHGDNLGAGRDAVEFRLIREMCRHDAGYVRAVRTAIDHQRKEIAFTINVGCKVQLCFAIEGAVVAFHAKIGHEFFISKIAVFIGVHGCLPVGVVVKHHTIV